MSVIDLVSSDGPNVLTAEANGPPKKETKDPILSPEIVEILSSSPPRISNTSAVLQTPQKQPNNFILTSSPLFEFEKLQLKRESVPIDPPPLNLDEKPKEKDPKTQTPSKPTKRKHSENGDDDESLFVHQDPFQLTPPPKKKTSSTRKTSVPKSKPIKTIEPQVEVDHSAHVETSMTFAARKEPTEPIESKDTKARPKFRDTSTSKVSAKRAASKTDSSSSKVAAASKASDRKVAGEKLIAHFHVDTIGWIGKVRAGFDNIEIKVQCKEEEEEERSDLPDGLTMLVTVDGVFDDTWDPELQVFVKSNVHEEAMSTAIISLSASYLDNLGKLTVQDRAQYFSKLEQFASGFCQKELSIIYFIPEIGVHFRKRVDKFNREMRRLVASGESGTNCMSPPDEHFYTNLEVELQILNGIRAYYPKKVQEAAEMMCNCIVDLGVSRYHLHMDETHDVAETYVKSKSTVLDITIESLTKVQGLPPRIAAKLGSEMKSLGKIREALGSNEVMRASRVKRFGQGTWNSSLLTFLEDDDPDKII